MNRFVLILTINFIGTVCFSNMANAAGNIAVGAISTDKTIIYKTPKSNAEVVTKVMKSDEFPIIKHKASPPVSQTHYVAMGETFYLIAKHYGVTVSELQRTNKILGTRLYVGQPLVIPQDTAYHRVKRSDSLWKISRQYNVSMDRLIKYNYLNAIVLKAGEELKIPEGFYKLQLLSGKSGWVKSSEIEVEELNRFNLGWKYNGTTGSYTKQLNISGLDVVSPRWYTLSDTNMVNISEDRRYASAANKAGKKVWPLFGNKFDPELTDAILSDSVKRKKVIDLITKSLVLTKSQGINVDFENIDPKNKQDYVVFIQELKQSLNSYDIAVSVDVSRENADPFWSGSLDRAALGKAADYIIMMGYDEHWATSQKAGSVASIPWTREGIELLMKEVPAHKIILGVPFYTREWITNSSGQVRSIDRTILETEKLIKEKGLRNKWDPQTLQNYVEFYENAEKHQIWIEDKKSMQYRYDLVKEFHLRGTAAWYVGGGPEDIWQILK